MLWSLILQSKKPDDFVIATNKCFTVKHLANEAYKSIGIKLKWIGKGLNEKAINTKTKETIIKIDKEYFRPNELNYLKGNYRKAKNCYLKIVRRTNVDKEVKFIKYQTANLMDLRK